LGRNLKISYEEDSLMKKHDLKGMNLLSNSLLNKGTAFNEE
jgi:hypothetical protein